MRIVQRGLATVVVSGLAIATLFIQPALYFAIEHAIERRVRPIQPKEGAA